MPDLLLELRSEEIPARMQRKAAGDLRKMVTDGLVEAGLTYEAAREYWTPRRLALDVRGVTARSKDVREEIKGPSTKAPEQAVQGFLRKAGLSDVSQAHVHSDPKKGDFYVAHISRPGRAADEIVAELVPAVIRAFPWPKSMRWGAASGPKGRRYGAVEGRGGEALRWVRPLQSILCTFGPETEEPAVVDLEVDGIRSGNVTYGHRFHAPDAFPVRRFDDYVAKLEAAKVVLDAERRKSIILSDAKNLAFAHGLELVEDEGLLEEVSGLVEWPVVLMGEFEEDYLQIPAEVIRLTIRANQKCFVTRPAEIHPTPDSSTSSRSDPPRRGEGGAPVPDASMTAFDGGGAAPSSPSTGEVAGQGPAGGGGRPLSNRFLLTANIEASDGGAEIARGNGKVVRARLSDALYFWKTDQADLPDLAQLEPSAEKFGLMRDASGKLLPLDQRMARLDHLGVTFHAKLGTQGERVERIARLAEEIAGQLEQHGLHPTPDSSTSSLSDPPRRGEGGAPSSPTSSPSTGEVARRAGGGESTFAQLARRAAVLAKADLQTEVVGEFPELQGVMGRKYALLQGEHPSVAAAAEEHYKPQGPSDSIPTDPVSIAVALADKLDTLVGFWAIDEKPTGSKDPYALRRAALGVVRIVVENGLRLALTRLVLAAHPRIYQREELAFRLLGRDQNGYFVYPDFWREISWPLFTPDGDEIWPLDQFQFEEEQDVWVYKDSILPPRDENETPDELFLQAFSVKGEEAFDRRPEIERDSYRILSARAVSADLLAFFHDRLKVYLRDKGARHDLIDAVLASGSGLISPSDGGGRREAAGGGDKEARGSETPTPALRADPPHKGEGNANDDLLAIVRRVEALGVLLDTDAGKNLLAGTKRAANILAAEEKKGTAIAAAVDPALFRDKAESALFEAVNRAESKAGQAIQEQDFSAAMTALSALREPVDSFFEEVLVNDGDAAIRANRLALLTRIRAATGQVADFSKIAG